MSDDDLGRLESDYQVLHRIAKRLMGHERLGHTLTPSDILHEALLRAGWARPGLDDGARLGMVVRCMRNVLVDYARRRRTIIRGGDRVRIDLDLDNACSPNELTRKADWFEARRIDVEEIDSALRSIEERSPELGAVATLRIFGGLEIKYINKCLGIENAQERWTKAFQQLRDHFGVEQGPRLTT